MIQFEFNERQKTMAVPIERWRSVLTELMQHAGVREGEISVAVVDDAEMHELNRQYLEHDYPTDVLSFVLDVEGDRLEGEIIISAEMARARSEEFRCSAEYELSRYLFHGALHLVGYRDKSDHDRKIMREQEELYLQRFSSVSNCCESRGAATRP